MLRFKINETPKPIEKPKGENSFIHPGYEAFEQVQMEGENYQLIQQTDGETIKFYLEHKFTGQKSEVSDLKGIKAFYEARDKFNFLEKNHPASMPGKQSPEAKKIEVIENEKPDHFALATAKMDAMFKEFQDKIDSRNRQIDAELMRQKLAGLREQLAAAESEFNKFAPEPVKQPDNGSDD